MNEQLRRAGYQTKLDLAKDLGITAQAVYRWKVWPRAVELYLAERARAIDLQATLLECRATNIRLTRRTYE